VITGSVLLALVAAVFLGLGLAAGSNADMYFYCSIVGSVLAGFALFAGLRRRPGAQLPEDEFDGPVPSERGWARRPTPTSGADRMTADGARTFPAPARSQRATGRASVPAALYALGPAGWEEGDAPDGWDEGTAVATRWPDDDDAVAALPDEPDEQELTATAAARVARLGAEVLVIDGRPRYHLGECLHLLGRTTHRLPVMDVVELGFTPCGECEPATALLSTSAG
jgi:hypothetical protein